MHNFLATTFIQEVSLRFERKVQFIFLIFKFSDCHALCLENEVRQKFSSRFLWKFEFKFDRHNLQCENWNIMKIRNRLNLEPLHEAQRKIFVATSSAKNQPDGRKTFHQSLHRGRHAVKSILASSEFSDCHAACLPVTRCHQIPYKSLLEYLSQI